MIKRVEHFFDRLAERIDAYQKGADDKVLKDIDAALTWAAWAMLVVTIAVVAAGVGLPAWAMVVALVVLGGVKNNWWFL